LTGQHGIYRDHIPFADGPGGAMQGPRYTTYSKLVAAKKLTDILSKL
jgi:hypothetical protein